MIDIWVLQRCRRERTPLRPPCQIPTPARRRPRPPPPPETGTRAIRIRDFFNYIEFHSFLKFIILLHVHICSWKIYERMSCNSIFSIRYQVELSSVSAWSTSCRAVTPRCDQDLGSMLSLVPMERVSWLINVSIIHAVSFMQGVPSARRPWLDWLWFRCAQSLLPNSYQPRQTVEHSKPKPTQPRSTRTWETLYRWKIIDIGIIFCLELFACHIIPGAALVALAEAKG